MAYTITYPKARTTMGDPLLRGFALGAATGAAAAGMLVCPLMVHEVRSELQAAWDADVRDSVQRCQAAYEAGRRDGIEMAEAARECGQEVAP